MGYTKRLREREQELGHPIRVGVVGAGQMGTGLVAVIERIPGMSVVALADHNTGKAAAAFRAAGRNEVVDAGTDLDAAAAEIERGGAVAIREGLDLPNLPVDIVVEASGNPEIAAQVAFACISHRIDVALLTIEADITVGLLLASLANAGGSVYTVMRGDEPIEALRLVEYAEDLGFEVVCAGKGKNNPNIPHSVPEDNVDDARRKGMNPRMLTEFTDGTKTQIEMTALSNARNMPIQVDGMRGKLINVADLATQLIPATAGGILNDADGPVVEYVTGDVAPGVFCIVKSSSDIVTAELDYLRLGNGPFYALYRPWHIASVEAPLSIAEAVLNRRADFQSRYACTETVGRAKRDLQPGETLDAMGTHDYYGWALPADRASELRACPIGLLQHSTVKQAVPQDQIITYDDLELDETRPLVAMRRLQDGLVARGVLGA